MAKPASATGIVGLIASAPSNETACLAFEILTLHHHRLATKTAATANVTVKYRQCNCRGLQMCSRFLVEQQHARRHPVGKKGRVKNWIGFVRERIFTPSSRVKNIEDMHGLLERNDI